MGKIKLLIVFLPFKILLVPHLEKEFPEIDFEAFDSVEDIQNYLSLKL